MWGIFFPNSFILCPTQRWETSGRLIPLVPTVKEELLFHTGAPEFVVQNGELKALDGRYCIITDRDIKKTKTLIEMAHELFNSITLTDKQKNLSATIINHKFNFTNQQNQNPSFHHSTSQIELNMTGHNYNHRPQKSRRNYYNNYRPTRSRQTRQSRKMTAIKLYREHA